jgi:NTE family protein
MGQATVVDWAPPEIILQSQSAMLPAFLKAPEGFYMVNLNFGSEPMTSRRIELLLEHLNRSFAHILIELPSSSHPGNGQASAEEVTATVQRQFLARSQAVYLLFEPCGVETSAQQRLLEEIRDRSAQAAKVRTVCCLPSGKGIDGFEFLGRHTLKGGDQNAAFGVHPLGCTQPPILIHDWPASGRADQAVSQTGLTSLFKADVRRLAREISGRLVGLALSSGAAKALAHVGVIQVLEENGIEVDMIAGASMGAYVGALWAFGHGGEELERLARELETRWGFWSLFDPIFPPRQGFVRGFALRKRLMRSIGTARFADLVRPMRIVAANLGTLDRVVFASGEVASAVHASIAVPGICVPVSIDGELYIDGGIVDPVPVDILREMGAAHVIAVNAIPAPGQMRHAIPAEEPKENRARKLFRKVLPIEKQLNYFAPGNLFEIVVRSIHGAQVRLAEASCLLADVVLRPNTCDDRWLDVRNPARFIKLGRQSAEKHLDEIKALAPKKQLNSNCELAREPMAAVA